MDVGGTVPFCKPFEGLKPRHVGTDAQLLAQRFQRRRGRAGEQRQLRLRQVIEDMRGDRHHDDSGYLIRLVQVFEQLFCLLWPGAFEQGFRPGTIERFQQGFAQLCLIGKNAQAAVMT
ncbi:hypothetical protein D3C77_449480 [compost metagenome]